MPLRTAPSIVAGQPVSVHAPARYRPGTRCGGGPQRPGAGHGPERRRPLLGDDGVEHRRVRGPAGSSCSSASRISATRARRTAGRSARRRRTATRPGTGPRRARRRRCGRTPTAPGVSTPAASSRSVTRRSKTTCTLTIGDAPSSAKAVRARRQRRSAAARQRRRGGRASTTASATTYPSSRSTPQTAPSADARCPRPVRRSRISTPAARRARAAAVAVQRRRAARGPADVGGVGVGRAARSEDLRGEGQRRLAAGRLSVGRAIRSQSAVDGRGHWPWAASQSPKREVVERRVVGVEPAQRAGPPARPTTARGRCRWRYRSERRPDGGAPAARARAHRARPGAPGATTGMSRRSWSVTPSDAPMRARKSAVGGAAAQEHVLAVVEPGADALERPGEAAETGAALEQRDRGAGVGAAQRGGDAGEAATDDHDPGPAHADPVGGPTDRARRCCARDPHLLPRRAATARPWSTAPGRAGCGRAAGGRCRPWRRRTPGSGGRAAAAAAGPRRTTSRARAASKTSSADDARRPVRSARRSAPNRSMSSAGR